MRQDAEFFANEELELVYIAARLKHAQRLEQALEEREINYLVEPDTYSGGVIFRRSLVGAFFYVRGEDAERTRDAVKHCGLKPYIPED